MQAHTATASVLPADNSALRTAVLELLGGDVYFGFDASAHALEVTMTGGATRPIFERIIAHLKPRSIIEVGTWNGASALHMAKLMKQHCGGGTIACVDTWLGSHHELWTEPYRTQLHLKHGYPMQYFQFLANVVKSGQQDVILPVPMTASAAARYFVSKGLSADCIYIDASHEEEDVYADLTAYWPLLRTGGIFFGDDYSPRYPGCIRAVNRFAYEHSLYLTTEEKKWMVVKAA